MTHQSADPEAIHDRSSTAHRNRHAIRRDRVRHVWFPLAVIALAVAWWLRRSAAMGYTTIVHVLVVLGSAALLSMWFVRCGPGHARDAAMDRARRLAGVHRLDGRA